MHRRTFFENIIALFGLNVVAPAVQAAVPRRIELQRSPVAGFQYHQGESVFPLLAVGASLSLIGEPDNPFDKRAVRVEWQGHKLGYVPRIDNAAASYLLDNNQRLSAEIVHLAHSNNPWERIEFALYLEI